MTLVAGVDSSTQSTKVVLCDAADGTVVGALLIGGGARSAAVRALAPGIVGRRRAGAGVRKGR